jgi:hypothetical protein
MNIYWMIQTPEFIIPRTRMFFHPSTRCQSRCLFLMEPAACLQVFQIFRLLLSKFLSES